jgi:hypothetical protein
MAHFVTFYRLSQKIKPMRFPFGATRGYWGFKTPIFTGNIFTFSAVLPQNDK